MKIWLLTIGEPVPFIQDFRERLHRTGQFAYFLSEQGNDVIWWTSTFDHWEKKHHCINDTTILKNKNLKIKLLNGKGYRSNASIARFVDHYRISKRFKLLAKTEEKPHIIISAFPDVELSSEAVKYGKKNRVPVIVDLRDMWPDIFVFLFPPKFKFLINLIFSPLFLKSRKIMRNAFAISGITDAFVDWGLAKGNRVKSRYDKAFPFAYHSVPPSVERIREAEKFWDEKNIIVSKDRFIVICIITVSRFGDFETLINAAKVFSSQGKNIEILICGDGDKLAYYQKTTKNEDNINFIGWIDAAKIYVLMRRASVGIDPLTDRYDFLATINNKAVEYLSAGLPVISSPKKGVLYNLLKDNECGDSYNVGDVNGFISTIESYINNQDLLEYQKNNALNLFNNRFRADIVYASMLEHLKFIKDNYS